MNMKTRIASIFGAAIMAFGVAAPTYAQGEPQPGGSMGESSDVDVNVAVGAAEDSGVRWTIQQTTPFEDVPFSLESQRTTGALTVTVTDNRGTREGWNFSVSATDLIGQNEGDVIDVENWRLVRTAVNVVTGQSEPMPVANAITMSNAAQPVFTAANGSGNGRYSALFVSELTIPGATVVDVYQGTLTISLNAAP